jgi:hypothetical protein
VGTQHAAHRMSAPTTSTTSTTPTTPTTPLRLSVIFVARRSLLNIQRALECLLSQTAAPRIELILSAASRELLREAEDFLASRARFEKSRFLLHRTEDLAQASALAVAETTGDAVAFIEDHCFSEPNWAEELLAAFESSGTIQAAAPVMLNPNPETALSRVQFAFFFGHHARNASARPRFEHALSLPQQNTAYRRDVLAEVLQPDSLLVEAFLQEKICIRRPQGRLVRCTHTALEHVNMSRLCPAIRQAVLGGRIFGGTRAKYMGWGPATRVMRFLLFPLVPLVIIRRSADLLHDPNSRAKTFVNFSTAWALELIHAFGESVGICFGKGNAAGLYGDTECDRRRFVRPAERHLLSGRTTVR